MTHHLRNAEDQLAGLNHVAQLAAQQQTNIAVFMAEPPAGASPAMYAAVAVGVPPNEAVQVLYYSGGYDVWTKGGKEMEVGDVSAERAAKFLVQQYREYKRLRLRE